MKKFLVLLWLLIPVILIVLYYGPGQKFLARDRAADLMAKAHKAEAEKDWVGAVEAYQAVMNEVPEKEKNTRWNIRLAHSRVRMFSGDLPEAMAELDDMLGDLRRDEAPRDLQRQVRSTLGMAQYYAGWLMRLEGAEPDALRVSWEDLQQAEASLLAALAQYPTNTYLNEKLLDLRSQQLRFVKQLAMLEQNDWRKT